MSKLSIIITTYQSSAIIKSCLGAINKDKYDIIVVDNNSQDETVAIIQSHFPQVKLIKLKNNIGYGRANNIALKQLQTDFAMLLNADAFILENDIEKIITIMEQNPEIAIAGPMIYGCKMDEENKISSKNLVTKINYKKAFGKNKSSEIENITFFYNQFITGAAMFLNMKIMRKVGFFDEGFFLYCEDNEICKRVIKKGYKTAIINNTEVLHLSGSSCQITKEERKRILWHKLGWSKLHYTKKIWGSLVARLKALRMIIKFSILILLDLIKGRSAKIVDKQAIKGCLAFFIGLGAFDQNDNPRG